MRVVEASQHLDLPLHFLEDTLLLNLALVENLDCNSVIGDLIYSHYTRSSKMLIRDLWCDESGMKNKYGRNPDEHHQFCKIFSVIKQEISINL